MLIFVGAGNESPFKFLTKPYNVAGDEAQAQRIQRQEGKDEGVCELGHSIFCRLVDACYFSIAGIRSHDRGNLEKKEFICGYRGLES